MSGLFLTYNSKEGFDGAGAQIQRQAAFFGISRLLRLGYKHSPLEGLSWNPNDGMSDELSRNSTLGMINDLFSLPESMIRLRDSNHTIELDSLTFMTLAKYSLIAAVTRQSLTLSCRNPYPIANFFPGIYKYAQEIWSGRFGSRAMYPSSKELTVSLHIRRAAVPEKLPNGRPNPRFVPDTWYLEILKLVARYRDPKQISVEIHSDYDPGDVISIPEDAPNNSRAHWRELGLTPNGHEFVPPQVDFSRFLNLEGYKSVQLVTKLTPLEAMIRMTQSDLLVGSRSSMSFIAGVIKGSEGKVIFPKFWHPVPREWVAIDLWHGQYPSARMTRKMSRQISGLFSAK